MSKDRKQTLKVGERIRIVDATMTMGEYDNGDEGEVTTVEAEGVMVFFDHYEEGGGSMYVTNGEYEVIEKDALTSFLNRKEEHLLNKDANASPAEALRSSILDIRSKREALHKELSQLDEQEKEAIEKLKEQGFILYEENVSEEALATADKAVLYAEDIEEDMDDPENWRIGDLVEAVNNSSGSAYRVGEVYEISWLQWRSVDDYVVITSLDSNECSKNGWGSANFKFHSRPVK